MAVKRSHRVKRIIQSVAGVLAEPAARPAIPTKLAYKAPADVQTVPTGFRPIDKALGIGGLPCGKITELIGSGASPIGSGTTCLTAKIAAKVQRQQEIVTIIDMNQSFDPWQAERCGLIAPQVLIARPDTLLAALATLESAARNSKLVIVVMGIVTGLLQHVEPESLKTLHRRLENIVKHSESVFIFVTTPSNKDPFNPSNYPDGFPLTDLAEIRLWVQEESWSHEAGLVTAYKANITVIKNRLAVAGKGADIRLKLAGT